MKLCRLALPFSAALLTTFDRGLAATCTRAIDNDAHQLNSAPPRMPEQQDPSNLVEQLLDRVSHLESMLRDSTRSAIDNGDSSIPPALDSVVRTTDTAFTSPIPAVTQESTDAATVLEFMAWGRRKDQDFDNAPVNESGPRRHSTSVDTITPPNPFAESVMTPQLDLLEILLPNERHVSQLVQFHCRSLLWYHGSYMALTLVEDVRAFYATYQGNIRHPEVNLQWVALLFAVLTGSMTCASPATASSWGFERAETTHLSRQWYNATTVCLDISDYMENHTLYSVQAISTLTISSHILGFSNKQSVLLATATRIAQSLGIHRLGDESTSISLSSEVDTRRRRKREAGRRVWSQLCTQDWFSIPFSESYSLNPLFFDTARPLNCSDEDMLPLPRTTPTVTSYCDYLYEIARLIPQLQDALASSNTLYTKYEHVKIYDEKMRKLATAYMPTFLSSNEPVASDWPVWVPWARRSLTICAAHKIIMIHRKFLGPSFTNSAFAFTRRTCIAAAKTILREAQAATDESGPILWIDQAFVVAAGIILCLDAFHRSHTEPEQLENMRLSEEAIVYLSLFTTSKIASRGITLISFLTRELANSYEKEAIPAVADTSRKRTYSDGLNLGSSKKRAKVFNLSQIFDLFTTGTEQPDTPSMNEIHTAAEIAWDVFADNLPPQTGFGSENLFSNLFDFEL
jgi:hypothetical protein